MSPCLFRIYKTTLSLDFIVIYKTLHIHTLYTEGYTCIFTYDQGNPVEILTSNETLMISKYLLVCLFAYFFLDLQWKFCLLLKTTLETNSEPVYKQ